MSVLALPEVTARAPFPTIAPVAPYRVPYIDPPEPVVKLDAMLKWVDQEMRRITGVAELKEPLQPPAAPAAPPAEARPQRHVWIAIPAYTGQIHLGTMRSIITDMLKLAERGDKVTIYDETGNAMIADCRGLIVAQFLASDATDLLFLDSDVIWQAGKLLELLDAPADFRVGIYPQRKDPINFCVRWDVTRPDLEAWNGLLPIDGAPAGFMLLSRRCLQTMVDVYTDLNFWCDVAPNKTVCGLFESYWFRDVPLPDGRRGNIKLGEDYSFCQRWRDMGGMIGVDPEIVMGHVGYKTFVGSLGDWLRANNMPKEDTQHAA